MPITNNILNFDADFMLKSVQKEGSSWAHFYDKYAPLMYGTILNMSGDKAIAEKILEEAFLELKDKEIPTSPCNDIRHWLLRHTYKLTLKHLKIRGLKAQPFNENYPVINLFYFEEITLDEVATKLEITQQEVLKKLRAEFNHFRNDDKYVK
jgi:DNA-directed RNA polymerase specialized sigma24 family protein